MELPSTQAATTKHFESKMYETFGTDDAMGASLTDGSKDVCPCLTGCFLHHS